jgi:hypothetical protein
VPFVDVRLLNMLSDIGIKPELYDVPSITSYTENNNGKYKEVIQRIERNATSIFNEEIKKEIIMHQLDQVDDLIIPPTDEYTKKYTPNIENIKNKSIVSSAINKIYINYNVEYSGGFKISHKSTLKGKDAKLVNIYMECSKILTNIHQHIKQFMFTTNNNFGIMLLKHNVSIDRDRIIINIKFV